MFTEEAVKVDEMKSGLMAMAFFGGPNMDGGDAKEVPQGQDGNSI